MPLEFKLYGKTLIINDSYSVFNELRKIIITEAEKASNEFTYTYYDRYGSIEKLLYNGYKDGRSLISQIIERVIISQVFMKNKIYDLDVNRFYESFYKSAWGATLDKLAGTYNEISNEIEALIREGQRIGDSFQGYANDVKKIARATASPTTLKESMSALVFKQWGLSESHYRAYDFWNKTLEGKRQVAYKEVSEIQNRIKQLKELREGLYSKAKVALKDEMYSSIIELLAGCYEAMCEYGLIDPNDFLCMNSENVNRANSIVNNMAHMSKNDVLGTLPELILLNPFNPNLYTALFSCLGDPNGELMQIAIYFGTSKELEKAKSKVIDKLFEKLKPDFYRSKGASATARKSFIKQAQLYGFSNEKIESMLRDFVSKARQEAARNPDNEVGFSGTGPLIIGAVIVIIALVNGEIGAAVIWGILCGIALLFTYNKDVENREIVSQEVVKAKQLLDNWEYDYSSESILALLSQNSEDKVQGSNSISPSNQLPVSINNSSPLSLPAQEVKLEKLKSVNQEKEDEAGNISKLVAHPINKNYEPIPGFETEALIKRAFLFLEDEEFDNAGRYLEQALNQDPENPRIYIGQLILTYQVHTIDELVDGLSIPIEDEKLFQRALRFADDDYKKKLEDLAQASRDKLEQARLEQERIQAEKKAEEERIRAEQEAEQKRIQAEREAELERKRAEEEARKEKIYQEILALKEKASPEISKFNEILKLAALIRSYKNTEKIYVEINQALQIELKYQNVLQEKRNAKSSQDWKNVISHLEALDGYKDTDELLNQAQEALEEVEERERARKKKIIVSAIVAVILAFSAWGINSYIENAKRLAEEQRIEEERIAREKAITEARIARENVMIAFFEGRYDDITSPDNFSSNSAIVNMLAHIDYEKAGANYDTLIKQAEDLRIKSPSSSNLDYKEAIELAGKYPNSNSANKFLGDVYLNGWGAGKDTQKALSYFKVSAEQGDVYSQILLASIYDSLNDKDNASKWYQKLADSGNALAQDKLRAFQEQQKRQEAEKAYIEAQASEASGNLDTALEQYRRALELGHPEAQKSLTALENKIAQEKAEEERRVQEIQEFQTEYSNGEKYLNDKDYSQAFEIFRRLAEQGYAPAQDKLAWMYQNGWGIEQSYTQAVYWFRKAAEQGNPEALASMGLMYLKGWGVEQNYDTSLEWYKKAASKGSTVAERRINSIEILKANKQKIASLNERNGFPLAGKIFAETLSVRQSANAKSRVIKTLRTGHPVSISRAIDSDNDYWFYIKTASGTEGWVLAGYVTIIDRDLTYEEINNRRYSLPKSGYVTTSSSSSFLNLRNIPAIEGSQVVEKLDNRTYFMAYEIFAGDTIDWYRVKPVSSNVEGWVSGKYIELNF